MNNIPPFPEFRAVCLSDREQLEGFFRALRPEASEFTFTNLFMFRHVHDYNLSELHGSLVILAKSYKGKPYFMPPLGGDDIPGAIDAMFDYMRGKGQEPAVELAEKGYIEKYVAPSDRYRFSSDPDNADYVYLTRDLAALAGRKFHDKKNLLNRFLRSFPDHEYVRMTPELVPQAMDLVARWCGEKCSTDIPSTFGETEATLLALDNLDKLGIVCSAVLVEGKVEAIAMGEELNPDMAVVHVEKANAAFAGLYQFISSRFLEQEFPGHKYVNREQDLGEPNLRKSKLSYNPVRMIEKYTVTPK